jgi:hypothetical protein
MGRTPALAFKSKRRLKMGFGAGGEGDRCPMDGRLVWRMVGQFQCRL